jgi:predicted glycosyltransferase
LIGDAQRLPVCELHEADAVFCATGKSGLGHLRRVTNIASALHQLDPSLKLVLVTNSTVAGLSKDEYSLFARVDVAERKNMASFLEEATNVPVIVDTAIVPGLEHHAGPICLILRETVAGRVHEFNLGNDRAWDLVCVPNPETHWLPPASEIRAKAIYATGWIMRATKTATALRDASLPPRLLVASGGGGTSETARAFSAIVEKLVENIRTEMGIPFHVTQIAGPRMAAEHKLKSADAFLDPGSKLNELFGTFDAVISTAGYNSVLELAVLDVPVLLVPISRSLDDQTLRAQQWASLMGHAYVEQSPKVAAHWLSSVLMTRSRRTAVRIDDAGALNCAKLIRGLLP